MFAKQEQVGIVLRTPAMKEKLVLLENDIAQLRCLFDLRSTLHDKTSAALLVGDAFNQLVVDAQFVFARLEPLHLKAILWCRHWAVGFIREWRGPTQMRFQGDSLCVVVTFFVSKNLQTKFALTQRAILENAKAPGAGIPSQTASD